MASYPCPVCIDACTEAAGAYFQGEWVYTPWIKACPSVYHLHINFKEVLALEPAVRHSVGEIRRFMFIQIIRQLPVLSIKGLVAIL